VTSATGGLVPVLACFQAILQVCPYPLFLAYAHPGDQRAEQPEGALGLYLAGPLHLAARAVDSNFGSSLGCGHREGTGHHDWPHRLGRGRSGRAGR